jgi:hypothetical protein
LCPNREKNADRMPFEAQGKPALPNGGYGIGLLRTV